MKDKKNLIKKTHLSISEQSRKYTEESKLILDNIRSEVIQANNKIASIYSPLSGDLKTETLKELRNEYLQNLTGYSIDKSRFKKVNLIDPDDLSRFNNNVRNSLSKNKDFYLYGDRSFLSNN